MNTLKKVTAKMSELMLKRSEEVEKVNTELARLEKEIEDGREFLLITDDTEEYTKKKKEIELNEQLVTVLKRKYKNVSSPLNDEEFNALKSEVVTAHNELMSEYGSRIYRELLQTVELMREYTEKAEYVSNIMKDLEDLNGRPGGMRKSLKADAIAGVELNDREEWFKNFIVWYYRRLAQVDTMKRVGMYK